MIVKSFVKWHVCLVTGLGEGLGGFLFCLQRPSSSTYVSLVHWLWCLNGWLFFVIKDTVTKSVLLIDLCLFQVWKQTFTNVVLKLGKVSFDQIIKVFVHKCVFICVFEVECNRYTAYRDKCVPCWCTGFPPAWIVGHCIIRLFCASTKATSKTATYDRNHAEGHWYWHVGVGASESRSLEIEMCSALLICQTSV